MSFDNTKYDLQFNNENYRIENYRKSEASTFVPRFTSGSQSETEFDLLKSKTIDGFAGGILQRLWKDDQAIFGSENLFPTYDDGVLYPVKDPTIKLNSAGGFVQPKWRCTAYCQNANSIWLAFQSYNGPTFNYMRRVDADGTVTSIGLPMAIYANPNPINDIVLWDKQLWGTVGVTNDTNARMFYMSSLTATSASEVSGTGTNYNSAAFRLVVWNGALYASGFLHAGLWRYTGTTTSRAWSKVGATGTRADDDTGRLFVFNGRIILSRTDGLWQYDGIRLAPIDDATKNISSRNYRFPTILKGYLYYWMNDGMYRFNGNMVEKLYDISEVGFPVAVCAGRNLLWVVYSNSQYSGSSRYDKSMGYDYTSSNSVNGRIACFDGKAMYTYARTTNSSKLLNTDFAGQGENSFCAWFNDSLYVFTMMDHDGTYFKLNTNPLTDTGTASWKLISSIMDGDFPMVDKSLENIEFLIDGDVASDETITVEYRTSGFAGSSGWATLGTIKTQSQLKTYVFTNVPAGITFKNLQLRFSGTTTLGYGFMKVVIRYYLSPDFKWQWDFTVNAFGDNAVEPLMLRDGSRSTQTVSQLRGAIYAARTSDVPVPFVDVDQLDLNGAVNSSATTLTLQSTALLKSKGFVLIDDEVIRYTGKTATTLTGCTRGSLGTTAASHADKAKIFAYYRVVLRQLKSEIIIMDDSDNDATYGNSRISQIPITLQEV